MKKSTSAFESVVRLFAARTGMTFATSRRAGLEVGIRRAMEHLGMTDPAAYAERVGEDPDALGVLIDELSVGETYFFREPGQFRFIRDAILPEILRRRGDDRAIRAWSAACSSGEEPYSLAMLLEDEGLGSRSRVVASDISGAALATARRATYSAWSLRDEGLALAGRHLIASGGRYEVAEPIRRRVTFLRQNLVADDGPGPGLGGMDLILCRNVLIYLSGEDVARVARRLFDALTDGGWLITASTDPPLAALAPFATEATECGLFYRKGPATALAFNPVASELGGAWPPSMEPDPAPLHPPSPPAAPAVPEGLAAVVRRLRAAIDGAAPGAEADCAEALAAFPLVPELHHLRALLLLGRGDLEEAARSARRALFLDPSSSASHYVFGAILARSGDRERAGRAHRNARDLGGVPSEDRARVPEGRLS